MGERVLDEIVQVCLKQPDLELAWVGDDAVDPLQQAQTLSLLVGAGIKTREEARAELGLAPEGPAVQAPRTDAASRLGKSNPYHDERGRFTTPDGAVAPDAATPPTPQSPATPEGGKAPENPSGGSNPGAGGNPNASPPASDSTARQQNAKPDAGPAEALGAPLASRVYEAAVRAAKDAIAAAEREAGSAIGEATGSIVERAVWGAMMSVASATAILLATTRPAGRGMVQGSVPGRSDITYDWNQEGLIAYHVLIDGQWRALGAFQDASGNVRDANGNLLATVSHGPGSTLSLTSDAAAIDRAAAALPTDTSQASSGLDQIYVDPSTGRTLVVPAGTDPVTLPPGFVPIGADGSADGSAPEGAGGSGDNAANGSSADNGGSAGAVWTPPPEAFAKIPPAWGAPIGAKKGKGGWRWFDPRGAKVSGIRIDPAAPNSPWPSQRIPHVFVRSNGVVLGKDGAPISGEIAGDATNAHIPLEVWLKWKEWNTP